MRDESLHANPEHHVQLEKILPDNHALRRVSAIVDAPLSSKVHVLPVTPENVERWHNDVARIQAAQAQHQGYQSPYKFRRSLRRITQSQGRTEI